MYNVKMNLGLLDIVGMFDAMGRKDNFSIQGIEAILDFLEETNDYKPFKLDIIAICCEFAEDSVSNIIHDYGNTFSKYDGFEDEDGDYIVDEVINILNEHTWAIELENGNILYVAF